MKIWKSDQALKNLKNSINLRNKLSQELNEKSGELKDSEKSKDFQK